MTGTAEDWQSDPEESGVFVGVLNNIDLERKVTPPPDLPTVLPGHPECADPGRPDPASVDGDPALSRIDTDCPGVVAERVIRVAADRVLWVQVRGDDPDQVREVLASLDYDL